MNGKNYYEKLNNQALLNFNESIKNENLVGCVQDLKTNIHYWVEAIQNTPSASLLNHAIEELDISCLQSLQGLYRGAYTSLRLALEMLCGAVYYSAYNIEFNEWSHGSRDIVWSTLTCEDNGILSKRFCNAYFKKATESSAPFLIKLKKLYRLLSEMVHGNNSTRQYNNPSLIWDREEVTKYQDCIETYKEVANFLLSIRFLKEIDLTQHQDLSDHIGDTLQSVEPIRVELGGPANE